MIIFKTDESGKIEVGEKGLPIAIDDSKPEGEQEFEIDAIHLLTKIPSLQAEAKKYRIARDEALNKLEAYNEIGDAKTAMEKLKEIEQLKQQITLNEKDKDKIEQMKAEILKVEREKLAEVKESYENIIKEKDGIIESQQGDIFDAMVTQRFNTSGFFSGKTPKSNMLSDVAKSYFGKYFKVEKDAEGKTVVIGYDLAGDKIYSREKGGEYADFDECIATIINQHPNKEHFLNPSKGTGAPGGGSGIEKSDSKKLAEMTPGSRLTALRRSQHTQ